MYAVIKTGGKQHRVSEGEVLRVEKIEGSRGDTIVFEDVLLVARDEDIRVGAPRVAGARVTGEIVTQTKGPKLNVFKKKRRKGYHKKTGHRQRLTEMKIKEIAF